ncbi:type 4a pilus biogenesis protein PilO [uncultured Desulfuromonas sp.]|uniref:type 4a pilus biogenesis protein PilO n=1 Tax=uncultured Desulfuromonas sp. TaxID=181013 RepID=UPI002AAB3393|nr:type 4a pilus biogenesis protein PilO [uncultured Desulfuromonas sp.]
MTNVYAILTALWQGYRIRTVLVLILLIAVFVTASLQNFRFAPELQDLRDQKLSLQQQVRQRDMAPAVTTDLTAKRLRHQMERFYEHIPERRDFSVFLGELYSWADDAGLVIDRITFNPQIDPANKLLCYALRFHVMGDYGRIRRFVYLLEYAPRLLIIEKISLVEGRNDSANDASVGLQIDLITYFREPGQ